MFDNRSMGLLQGDILEAGGVTHAHARARTHTRAHPRAHTLTERSTGGDGNVTHAHARTRTPPHTELQEATVVWCANLCMSADFDRELALKLAQQPQVKTYKP